MKALPLLAVTSRIELEGCLLSETASKEFIETVKQLLEKESEVLPSE